MAAIIAAAIKGECGKTPGIARQFGDSGRRDHAGAPAALHSADALLERLVALNAERAAEEANGTIRWLRPAFQNPEHAPTAKAGAGVSRPTICDSREEVGTPPPPPAPNEENRGLSPISPPISWPATLPEQMAAVARVLGEATAPLNQDDLAARFTGKGPRKKTPARNYQSPGRPGPRARGGIRALVGVRLRLCPARRAP